MKIGLYGGTFDPVHFGHLLLAEWLREELNLREIIFIPAAIPPHKQDKSITSSELRWQMLKLAIQGNPSFKISDFELKNKNISYSLRTILHFRNALKISSDNIFFLIGADNLETFSSWYKPDEIIKNCQIVVYRRPGNTLANVSEKYLKKMKIMHNPLIEISSSDIRNRIGNGQSVKYMIPSPVEALIYENNLYKNKS